MISEELLKDIENYGKEKNLELESWEFNKETKTISVIRNKHKYYFDLVGFKVLRNFFKKDNFFINIDGYFCTYVIRDKKKIIFPIHRFLMIPEIGKMAKKLNCDVEDIHVHHKNIRNPDNKYDDRLSNLEVLHKDIHAQRHGYLTWELYQRARNYKKKHAII